MIFVDTSYWVAYRNRADDRHATALALLREHRTESFVTTNHVRGETWTFLRRRAGHRAAVDFLDDLGRSPRFDVVFVDQELEEEAVRWLRGRDERSCSFVDATSFAVMRKARIADVLCFDEDFVAAGFNVLHPSGTR